MKMSALMTSSMQDNSWGDQVARVLNAALQAVEPSAAVGRFIKRDGKDLIIAGQSHNLDEYKHIYVVGAGKAGTPMASSVAHILGERLTTGIVIVKEGYLGLTGYKNLSGLSIIEAGHPVPDERGVQAAQQIIELLKDSRLEDLVICLISGGGSALFSAPIQGVSLEDLQMLSSLLLASGATINEFNSLRKHLDRVKGGQLARLAAPATVRTLILSDVVGNSLDVIASGPTVPDSSTFQDAYQVLQRYDILEHAPKSVVAHLRAGIQGELPETPKPGDPIFANVQNVIIGSNLQAAEAAVLQAREEGFNTLLLTIYLEGEARDTGQFLGSILHQVASHGQPIPRPACIVAGGETTVTLHGDGLGGRNQELALGAVSHLAGLQNVAMVTLATDGGDGPTDAAGAIVTGETLQLAKDIGLDPAGYLARNDAYYFFEPLGDLLKLGPTNTNVNDLVFLFAFL